MIRGRLNYRNENLYYYIGNVFEYDIKHAYPSLLKDTEFRFYDKDLRYDIQNLNEYSDKKKLLIRIGKEIGKNKDISVYLNNSLMSIVEEFQIKNNLEDKDIIAIKKDALFVIKQCKELNFKNNIEFIEKNNFNMYFFDYISKFEYYIRRRYGNLDYSIKGIGDNTDQELCGNLCKLIYRTLVNNDLSFIKDLQEKFMKSDLRSLEFCPSVMLYKNYIYLPKEKLLNDKCLDLNEIKEIYFKYYASVCKSLINYLI